MTMFLRTYTPGPPLDEYIDRFWFCSDTPPHPRERITPSGTAHLVINLSDDEIRIDTASGCRRRFSGAAIAGPYSNLFLVDPLVGASLIGVCFRPGRAAPVLGAPLSEFTDTHVDLESVWGRKAAELRERLWTAATPTRRFAVLEEVLRERMHWARPWHGAISVALNAFEQADATVHVRNLAQWVGLSQRRFIQLFRTEVGLTPKLYGRVRRFQRARELAQRTTDPDWAAVAVTCGYFDQSHLIRDFREFCGLSPVAYLNQRTQHVLLKQVPWVG